MDIVTRAPATLPCRIVSTSNPSGVLSTARTDVTCDRSGFMAVAPLSGDDAPRVAAKGSNRRLFTIENLAIAFGCVGAFVVGWLRSEGAL